MGPNAREADRRIGERMVEDEVRWLGAKATELLAAYDQAKPATHKPLTFLAIEQIWANEVFPRLSEFKSMQYGNSTTLPADSLWQLNYKIPDLARLQSGLPDA